MPTDFPSMWLAGLTVSTESTNSGRWLDAAMPKDGWSLVGVRDRGSTRVAVCEFCARGAIRFVYTVSHPRTGRRLEVGPTCAGKLSGDPRSVEAIGKIAVQAAHDDRANWLKGWRIYTNSAVKQKDRANFRVSRTPSGWEWTFMHQHVARRSEGFYGTSLEAKEALFSVWKDHQESLGGEPALEGASIGILHATDFADSEAARI
jgi:hypothetical protein